MDYLTFFLVFSFLFAYSYALTLSRRRNSRLPPGPFPLPIIGNILQLGANPHRSLAALSKTYGPLMSLKLGSKTTVVLSSPEIAKEFLQTHDQSFSGRSLPMASKIIDHHKYSIVWLPTGKEWRTLRRISKEHIFSLQRLEATQLVLQEKVKELIDQVDRYCTSEKAVNIGGLVYTTILNVLSNLMFSIDLTQYDSMLSQEFKDATRVIIELAGKPNIADVFPIFESFDPQGILRHGNVYGEKIMNILDRIIDERFKSRSHSSFSSTKNDVLDSLLNLTQKDKSEFNQNDMKHLFFSLFIAGGDTTTNTLEWAMAELIRNPMKMKMARSEIIKLIENKKNIIQESDIPHLPYLQSIIKETLRLHPPTPFLIPHQAICDVEIQGFMIPKNTQVLCNVWAIGRNPKVWSQPEIFMPERFLEMNIDYKGHDFELMPFGAGRRICPGVSLSHQILHVLLGSLIQTFNWKLEGNIKSQDLDMSEKFGLGLQRKLPLKAIPLKI